MSVLLFTLLIVSVLSVNIEYTVTCVDTPTQNRCGAGGKYTLTQLTPIAGPPIGNPDITCTVGDILIFTFPLSLPRHPFDIESSDARTFPGLSSDYPFTKNGSVTFNCDEILLHEGPANYICMFHPAMTGKITAIEPTNAPTEQPTKTPTERETNSPTEQVTNTPTEQLTNSPTEQVTNAPTERPTNSPTEQVTNAPTERETNSPTEFPTSNNPTSTPTASSPTEFPASAPTNFWSTLDAESLSKVQPYLFRTLTSKDLSVIPPKAFQGLTRYQMRMFPFSPDVISYLDRKQASNINPDRYLIKYRNYNQVIPNT